MAEVAAAVVGLIDGCLAIIDRITATARIVKSFPDEAKRLARRVRNLKPFISRIKETPSKDLFEDQIEDLENVFKEAEAIQKKASAISQGKAFLKESKYKGRYVDIHNKISVCVNDLCLALNVELPEEEGDDPTKDYVKKKDSIDQFPPTIYAVAPPEPDPKATATTCNSNDDDPFSDLDPPLPADFVELDFSKPAGAGDLFGFAYSSNSSFSSSASRKDRKAAYSKLIAVRATNQSAKVTKVRIVLANLDPGDTTLAAALAGTAANAVGVGLGAWFGAVGIVHNAVGVDISPVAFAQYGYAMAGNTFLHWLLEIDLEDQGIVSLERCAEDVFLYGGPSSRYNQHAVCEITVDTSTITLRDLILFRNKERMTAYSLVGNNCIDFVIKFLFVILKLQCGRPRWEMRAEFKHAFTIGDTLRSSQSGFFREFNEWAQE